MRDDGPMAEGEMSRAGLGVKPRIEVVDGRWSILFAGLPIAADGDTLLDAIEDTIEALREYAEDWIDHLHRAPNHEDKSDLVQLVSQSSDEQLQGWLLGFAPTR